MVDFLASIDEENEVHIISSYGITYATPGLENGIGSQCGVNQGTSEGPFIWLAVDDIAWTEVERVSPNSTGAKHGTMELSEFPCPPLWTMEFTSTAATRADKKSWTLYPGSTHCLDEKETGRSASQLR